MPRKWYCAGVLRNKDGLAIQHLERQGYEVFCPRLLKTVSHARKRTRKLVPLFPGYLFVSFDIDVQRWRPIDGTIGVTHLVKTAGMPAPVDERFMSQLVDGADDAGVVSFQEKLEAGDTVRAIGGALDRHLGTILRMSGPDRIVVLMSMLGRAVEVTVPSAQLIKAA